MEARLIGYDETPIDVNTPDAIGFEKLTVQQPFDRDFEPKIIALTKVSNSNPPCITPVIKHPPGFIKGQACRTAENPSCNADLQSTGNYFSCWMSSVEQVFHSLSKTKIIFQVGHTKQQQDRDCMKYVLLTVGNPLDLNVAKRKDQAI